MAKKIKKFSSENKIPRYLILLGILILILGIFIHLGTNSRYFFSQREKQVSQVFGSDPKNLTIPSLGMDVSVSQGGIKDGEWILSDKEASYLPTSGELGEGFNTIIYAHNTLKLFNPLKYAELGEVIVVKDTKGKEYRFVIFSKEDIDPSNLQKLYTKEKNVLTLFTCDGWFDQSRLIIRARLVK